MADTNWQAVWEKDGEVCAQAVNVNKELAKTQARENLDQYITEQAKLGNKMSARDFQPKTKKVKA